MQKWIINMSACFWDVRVNVLEVMPNIEKQPIYLLDSSKDRFGNTTVWNRCYSLGKHQQCNHLRLDRGLRIRRCRMMVMFTRLPLHNHAGSPCVNSEVEGRGRPDGLQPRVIRVQPGNPDGDQPWGERGPSPDRRGQETGSPGTLIPHAPPDGDEGTNKLLPNN